MYDELVMRLREAPNDCPDADLHYEAAEVIEEEDMAFRHLERDYKELCAHLPKWIPVTDRMPDENEDVLVYGEWTGASGTKYREIWLTDLKSFLHQGYKLIAWMPLPEPPKEE